MKLAEALILRADYTKRIQALKTRIIQNAKVQEGDKPSENPDDLLEQLGALLSNLSLLIQRVNRTNSLTPIDPWSENGVQFDGMTIADAIVLRDSMKLSNSIYNDIANAGLVTGVQYSRTEIKYVSKIDVANLHAIADDAARNCRSVDTRVQQANWNTDLLE